MFSGFDDFTDEEFQIIQDGLDSVTPRAGERRSLNTALNSLVSGFIDDPKKKEQALKELQEKDRQGDQERRRKSEDIQLLKAKLIRVARQLREDRAKEAIMQQNRREFRYHEDPDLENGPGNIPTGQSNSNPTPSETAYMGGSEHRLKVDESARQFGDPTRETSYMRREPSEFEKKIESLRDQGTTEKEPEGPATETPPEAPPATEGEKE